VACELARVVERPRRVQRHRHYRSVVVVVRQRRVREVAVGCEHGVQSALGLQSIYLTHVRTSRSVPVELRLGSFGHNPNRLRQPLSAESTSVTYTCCKRRGVRARVPLSRRSHQHPCLEGGSVPVADCAAPGFWGRCSLPWGLLQLPIKWRSIVLAKVVQSRESQHALRRDEPA